MVRALIDGLHELGKYNDNVVFFIADDKEIYDGLYTEYPDRTVNVGISECNAISVGAGVSSCNIVPYIIGGNTFMAYRAYEFIRNQLCMQNRNVKVIGIGAGMAISILGNTQHATEDMGALRSLPNMTIMTPATPAETYQMIIQSIHITTPLFVRIGRAGRKDFYEDGLTFLPFNIQQIRQGQKIAVFSIGSIICDVFEAADILSQNGINVGIINVHTVKPLDKKGVVNLSKQYDVWISVEEHNIIGGLGSALSEVIVDEKLPVRLKKVALKTFAKGYGSHEDIKLANHLGVQDIINACLEKM